MKDLHAYCEREHQRHHTKLRSGTHAHLLPRNLLSDRMRFYHCRKRRQGYMAYVEAEAFAAMFGLPLSPERLADAEFSFRAGIYWPPIGVKATREGRWVARAVLDADLATFAASKGVAKLPVQVFELEDVQATEEGLELLRQGLFLDVPGTGGCPVLEAMVTL